MEDYSNNILKSIVHKSLILFLASMAIFVFGVFASLNSHVGYFFSSLIGGVPINSSNTSSNHYAYGENIGWIDFNPTGGSVQVGDNGLTGYAWAENVGWIKLGNDNAPPYLNTTSSNWGVVNDGYGNLSGYAYGENIGWINFDPTFSGTDYGVKIDTSGDFSGYAYGENTGWISFNCATTSSCASQAGNDYKVITDWRHNGAAGGTCRTGDDCDFGIDCTNNVCTSSSSGNNPNAVGGAIGYHSECNALKQCVRVYGAGNNQCDDSGDCSGTTHNICNAQKQCISVDGGGDSQCRTDVECSGVTHNACNAQKQCISVTGSGTNQCYDADDCSATAHNECDALKQCVFVAGPGADACDYSTDCTSTKHNACNAQKQCVSVTGSGANQCNTNTDCLAVKHNECNDLKCIVSFGPGIKECTIDSDCKSKTHSECDALKQCVVVSGPGTDLCKISADCAQPQTQTQTDVTNYVSDILKGLKISPQGLPLSLQPTTQPPSNLQPNQPPPTQTTAQANNRVAIINVLEKILKALTDLLNFISK
jgi:hypothetical protein